MKTIHLVFISLFITNMSYAQTDGTPMTNEISQTRDYVSSVINRMSSSSTEKYSISADYSVAGKEFNEIKNLALKQFKQSMDSLSQSSFSSTINEYNTLVNDNTLCESEKTMRLNLQYQSLTSQAGANEVIYQKAISMLFKTTADIFVLNFDPLHSWGNAYFNSTKNEPDYQQYNVSIIKQINDVLEKKCTVEPFNNPSQSCITNLLSDLVQFYFDVSSQINRDLVITLADGKTITLHQSEDGSILKTLQILKNNFQLNQNFETLPFKY